MPSFNLRDIKYLSIPDDSSMEEFILIYDFWHNVFNLQFDNYAFSVLTIK